MRSTHLQEICRPVLTMSIFKTCVFIIFKTCVFILCASSVLSASLTAHAEILDCTKEYSRDWYGWKFQLSASARSVSIVNYKNEAEPVHITEIENWDRSELRFYGQRGYAPNPPRYLFEVNFSKMNLLVKTTSWRGRGWSDGTVFACTLPSRKATLTQFSEKCGHALELRRRAPKEMGAK